MKSQFGPNEVLELNMISMGRLINENVAFSRENKTLIRANKKLMAACKFARDTIGAYECRTKSGAKAHAKLCRSIRSVKRDLEEIYGTTN